MKLPILLAAALLPFAVPAGAQLQMPPPAPTTAAMPFLMLASESDIFEITSSQIALTRSQNPRVREYGTMLIRHHTMTTNLALAQAKAAGITPPPAILQQDKRDMITQLLEAQAADFDRVYLSQQVPAHEQALALHSAYARGGDTPQLRTLASSAVPIVQQHLTEARRMLAAS